MNIQLYREKFVLIFAIIFNVVWSAITLFFLCAVAAFIVMAFDRTPPVDIENVEVSPVVVAGESIIVDYINVNRKKSCDLERSSAIISKSGKRTDFDNVNILNPGKIEKIEHVIVELKTDATLETGPSILRITLNWKCPNNWYELIQPLTRTDEYPFTVVKKLEQ